MDAKQLKEAFEKHGIRRVKVGGFDVDGVLRGKYVSLDKFWGALEEAIGFCDVDLRLGRRRRPLRQREASPAGTPATPTRTRASTRRRSACCRGSRTPPRSCSTSSQADGYAPPGVPARPAPAGHRAGAAARLRARVRRRVRVLRLQGDAGVAPREGLPRPRRRSRRACSATRGCARGSTRTSATRSSTTWSASTSRSRACTPRPGPGVYEVAIHYDDALRAADKAALFKTAMKQLAARLGYAVTFMAKWNAELPGSSGHLHQSLWKDGKNVFYDAAGAASS